MEQLIPAIMTIMFILVGISIMIYTRNANSSMFIKVAQDVVTSVVLDINQTVVAEYKKANADGKLTAKEAKQVFNLALMRTQDSLNANIVSAIERLTNDSIDNWLSREIEKNVVLAKK